jgi:hypothetical protein
MGDGSKHDSTKQRSANISLPVISQKFLSYIQKINILKQKSFLLFIEKNTTQACLTFYFFTVDIGQRVKLLYRSNTSSRQFLVYIFLFTHTRFAAALSAAENYSWQWLVVAIFLLR